MRREQPKQSPLVFVVIGGAAFLFVGIGVALWLVNRAPGSSASMQASNSDRKPAATTKQAKPAKQTPTVDPAEEERKRKEREVEDRKQREAEAKLAIEEAKKKKWRDRTEKMLLLKSGPERDFLRRMRDDIEAERVNLSALGEVERNLLHANVAGLLNDYLLGKIAEDTGKEGEDFATAFNLPGGQERVKKLRFAYWFYDGADKQLLKEIGDACRKNGGFANLPAIYKQYLQEPKYTLVRSAITD